MLHIFKVLHDWESNLLILRIGGVGFEVDKPRFEARLRRHSSHLLPESPSGMSSSFRIYLSSQIPILNRVIHQ
jgi:hypothetical protein